MVWYDIVILCILAYATWQGAQRGLVTQLAWIAALILCFKFADTLAPAIEPQISVEQPLRHWIAMFILYLGFSLGAFMVARILTSWLEAAKFKDFDRHLGGLFGLVKGVVFALVATFFAVTLSQSLKSTVLQSRTGYAACIILDSIEPLTPEYFSEYLARYKTELAPLHDEHGDLGDGTTEIPEWTGGATSPGGETDGPGGFSLPDFMGGLVGSPDPTSGSSTGSGSTAGGPTLDQLWRTLPQQMKDQFGAQVQQQWKAATPQQRQNLVDSLSRSFVSEMPAVVSQFLTSAGQGSSGQGSASPGPGFAAMLNEIGDIYQDRQLIVQRTTEHLAGIPPQVQAAVIKDWYADLSLQATDPDPLTNVQTRLDERILRQLEKARVPLTDLALELRQRLNLSRQ